MEDEIFDGDFEIEENPDSIPKTMDEDLEEWLDAVQGAADVSYQATLYKYLNSQHGNRKEVAGQWEDEIPSLHDVGLTYGGGRYQMLVAFPEKINGKRLIRAYKFRIHKHYDKQSIADNSQVVQQVQFDPNLQMQTTIGMVKEIVAMVAMMKPEEVPPVPQIGQSVDLINDVIKSSAKASIETHKELLTAMKNQTIEQETEEPEDKTAALIQSLAPLLETFLPILLGSGPQSKIIAETVKATPVFKKILKSKKDLAEFIEHSIENNGKVKTISILKKLKVSPTQIPVKYKQLLLGKSKVQAKKD